jgi:DNA-binding NarL/FixJ family response regulator
VVTSYDYPQYADAALRLGAAGFVVKTAPTAELLDAIRGAASGGLHFGVRPGNGVSLSERERQVLHAVIDGASNDEIGARLGISARTVESHLRRLFERHDVASRTELASRALREGWLEEVG